MVQIFLQPTQRMVISHKVAIYMHTVVWLYIHELFAIEVLAIVVYHIPKFCGTKFSGTS